MVISKALLAYNIILQSTILEDECDRSEYRITRG